ncbi:Putative 1-phosphatidylinositol-3-phosphate 5-kinase FAB1C [Apostasia shenzhenica]|uniref:1-phosphatidylinositol-3-phosphate 5-kinase n=1 Tax=Apostasia shenzhenica TaxID=1088818 RepID=A0A2I0BBG7_9ASPA|nr:Putative 1-phosphatidylinositol-3-phosphate 5-kinase FAB1C [Apostasia shenzhenica]
MGVAIRPLIDLLVKLRSWSWDLSGSPEAKSWMSTLSDKETCLVCLSLAASQHCRRCGGTFCRKCAAGACVSEAGHLLELCGLCQSSITAITEVTGQEYEERLPLHDSSIGSPASQHTVFSPNSLAELQQFSSSSSLRCSTNRIDEEEDGDDSGTHFVSPTSEFSQDVFDIESSSMVYNNELYSFKSANSSPWDSPSRGCDNGDYKVSMSDQEDQGCSSKPSAEVGDSYYVYDNLLMYRSHVNQKAQQPLDLANNELIWYPPPPEVGNDDVADGFFEYSNDDDDVDRLGFEFLSSSFPGDAFPVREKFIDPHREHLRNAVHVHFTALVSQLLKDEKVELGSEKSRESWLEIVSSLALQAASFIKPDTRSGGSMDPTHYVKVKCVASGSPCDSTFVKGVVFTKNVKHKRMVSQHKCPRLLLLGGALEYQRASNKLASINTILEEEIDHLKMAVAKIEAHRPNVLLVEKSVSSYAQEYLLAKEISLVLNVKRSILETLSRCTGAQIVPSIDYIAMARLGHCEMFQVEKIVDCHPSKKSIKKLMYFEGCPRRLGCTVILRGPCLEKLKKVKRVVSLATFAAYHLSLETSFLADEGATLPKFRVPTAGSLSESLLNIDANITNTSSRGWLNSATVAENHHKADSWSRLSMQGLPPNCDVSYRNNKPLTADSEPTERSHSLNDMLNSDISSSYIGAFLHEIERTRSDDQFNEPSTPKHIVKNARIHEEEILHYEGMKNRNLARSDHLDVAEECFSAADNQSILVSLSSTCASKGTVCERSHLFRIKFYGSFDKPLGRFLHDDLFDQTSSCRSCKEPVEAHIHRYTHLQGSLSISVKKLTTMKLPGEQDGRIWMWHRCLNCEPKDGVPPATHRVVLSDSAWGLSFGKFLELSFSNTSTANRLSSCGHSLQKDCLRFFGFGNMVAFFRYSPVDILTIYLPRLVLDFSYHTIQGCLQNELSEILSSFDAVYTEVFNVLKKIEQKIIAVTEPVNAIIHKRVLELNDVLKRERNEYEILLKPSSENIQSPQVLDILELNRLRCSLLIDSVMWDRRLCLLDSFLKSKVPIANVHPQILDQSSHMSLTELGAESIVKEGCVDNSFEESGILKQKEEFGLQILECSSSSLVEMDLSIESVEGYAGAAGFSFISGQCFGRDGGQRVCGGKKADALCSESMSSLFSNLSDRIDLAWTGSSQSLTDLLAYNAESDSVPQLSLRNSPQYRKLMSPVRVHSFDSALRLQRKVNQGLSPLSLHLSPVKSFNFSGVSGCMASIPSNCGAYFGRSLTSLKGLNFLASHIPVFISSIDRVISDGARLLMPRGGPDNIVIPVYDNEPTSIICYAISSQEHTNFINHKATQHEVIFESDKSTAASARPSVSQFQVDELKPLADLKELHFRFSFGDEYSFHVDKVKFSVTCYYAKQFDAIRRKCCTNNLNFIRSMSRCKKWNAQGGKSNVYFAKSMDERFIIKQITRTELDSFEDFAPDYFNYLTESINSGSPTCLAKVLGIYQVWNLLFLYQPLYLHNFTVSFSLLIF